MKVRVSSLRVERRSSSSDKEPERASLRDCFSGELEEIGSHWPESQRKNIPGKGNVLELAPPYQYLTAALGGRWRREA